MSNGREFDQPGTYEIAIRGTFDRQGADWFDGSISVSQTEHHTVLTASVTDQIALHGLLSRIRDLGLPLLSVKRLQVPCSPDRRPSRGGQECTQ